MSARNASEGIYILIVIGKISSLNLSVLCLIDYHLAVMLDYLDMLFKTVFLVVYSDNLSSIREFGQIRLVQYTTRGMHSVIVHSLTIRAFLLFWAWSLCLLGRNL